MKYYLDKKIHWEIIFLIDKHHWHYFSNILKHDLDREDLYGVLEFNSDNCIELPRKVAAKLWKLRRSK